MQTKLFTPAPSFEVKRAKRAKQNEGVGVVSSSDAARVRSLAARRWRARDQNLAPTSVPRPSGCGTGSATPSTRTPTGNSLRSFSVVRINWKKSEMILQIRLYEEKQKEINPQYD